MKKSRSLFRKIYDILDIETAIENKTTETIKISKAELQKEKIHIHFVIVDTEDNTYNYDIELSINETKK